MRQKKFSAPVIFCIAKKLNREQIADDIMVPQSAFSTNFLMDVTRSPDENNNAAFLSSVLCVCVCVCVCVSVSVCVCARTFCFHVCILAAATVEFMLSIHLCVVCRGDASFCCYCGSLCDLCSLLHVLSAAVSIDFYLQLNSSEATLRRAVVRL